MQLRGILAERHGFYALVFQLVIQNVETSRLKRFWLRRFHEIVRVAASDAEVDGRIKVKDVPEVIIIQIWLNICGIYSE